MALEPVDMAESIARMGKRLERIDARISDLTASQQFGNSRRSGLGLRTTQVSASNKLGGATQGGLLRQILAEVAELEHTGGGGEARNSSVLGRLFVELAFLQQSVQRQKSGRRSTATNRSMRSSSGLRRSRGVDQSLTSLPPAPPAHSPDVEAVLQECFERAKDGQGTVAIKDLLPTINAKVKSGSLPAGAATTLQQRAADTLRNRTLRGTDSLAAPRVSWAELHKLLLAPPPPPLASP